MDIDIFDVPVTRCLPRGEEEKRTSSPLSPSPVPLTPSSFIVFSRFTLEISPIFFRFFLKAGFFNKDSGPPSSEGGSIILSGVNYDTLIHSGPLCSNSLDSYQIDLSLDLLRPRVIAVGQSLTGRLIFQWTPSCYGSSSYAVKPPWNSTLPGGLQVSQFLISCKM